ncbi:hypothetical protein HYALB_00010386 [Hymenoscyphus albidus]|uniref:Uncharacterized protein n=1 Tax=Hymenoscyphus albidus TaxID=595503 RepID=A0A9N9LHT2_9HELO|nr:hypothetical protein HYALB_00010386 [Hymenoscyphus albidus]
MQFLYAITAFTTLAAGQKVGDLTGNPGCLLSELKWDSNGKYNRPGGWSLPTGVGCATFEWTDKLPYWVNVKWIGNGTDFILSAKEQVAIRWTLQAMTAAG